MISPAPRPCSRRLFLLGTATTFAGALVACGSSEQNIPQQDVPVGSAVIVGEYIIAQPTAGEYKAYTTVCPHQGRQISEISGTEAICHAHKSHFDLATGEPVAGPARAPLEEVPLQSDGDSLRVST